MYHIAANEAEILATLPYRAGHEIRVTRSVFKGRELVDLRIWIDDALPPDEGAWIPTKKGIAVPVERLGELVELMREAHDRLTTDNQEDDDE